MTQTIYKKRKKIYVLCNGIGMCTFFVPSVKYLHLNVLYLEQISHFPVQRMTLSKWHLNKLLIYTLLSKTSSAKPICSTSYVSTLILYLFTGLLYVQNSYSGGRHYHFFLFTTNYQKMGYSYKETSHQSFCAGTKLKKTFG